MGQIVNKLLIYFLIPVILVLLDSNNTEVSLGVVTINIPDSNFSEDSCTTLDPLHNFRNVSCNLWLH